MASDGSVTHWIHQLQEGDSKAVQPIWERYFERLVRLARSKFRSAQPRGADEEDVALSALDSFCRGAEAGRFPQLEDRDNLWRLLVVITARKAVDLIRHEQRQKRGGAWLPAILPFRTKQLRAWLDRELSRSWAGNRRRNSPHSSPRNVNGCSMDWMMRPSAKLHS